MMLTVVLRKSQKLFSLFLINQLDKNNWLYFKTLISGADVMEMERHKKYPNVVFATRYAVL